MNTYQDEQPERDYQPRVKLSEPLQFKAGYIFLVWMFNHPYEPFILPYYPGRPDAGQDFNIHALAQLCGNGLIAVAATGDGFQLTADGRYYVAQELNQLEHEYLSPDEARDFDLTPDGRNPDDREWMYRVRDTY